MADHRKVKIPFSDIAFGFCRWCGEEITVNGQQAKRRRWHLECLTTYKLSWPNVVRRNCWVRDGSICAGCGRDCDKPPYIAREIDHILPLIDGGGHGMDNVQTLCIECHKAKTSAEATARAKRRRYREANRQ